MHVLEMAVWAAAPCSSFEYDSRYLFTSVDDWAKGRLPYALQTYQRSGMIYKIFAAMNVFLDVNLRKL